MDQNVQYFECLERVTREMVSPEQIRVDKIVVDLQELCKLLRVFKFVLKAPRIPGACMHAAAGIYSKFKSA